MRPLALVTGASRGLGELPDAIGWPVDVTDQWRTTLEANVVAVAELTRLLLPALRAARGHVVLINSGAGRNARAGWASYAASKFALRAFGDVLRAEEPSLRVTAVFPGRIDTDMQRAIVAGEDRAYDPSAFLKPERSPRQSGWPSTPHPTHTRPRSRCDPPPASSA